jgi:hypothetical protein
MEGIQRQAEEAISSGALDIDNAESINLAITKWHVSYPRAIPLNKPQLLKN